MTVELSDGTVITVKYIILIVPITEAQVLQEVQVVVQ